MPSLDYLICIHSMSQKFTFSDALNSLATARTGQEELQALHEEITQVPWQILKKALEKTFIQDKPPSWFTLDESVCRPQNKLYP